MSESKYVSYGKALYDLVGTNKAELEEYQKALHDIEEGFFAHPELQATLASYSVPLDKLYGIVEEAYSHFELKHLVPFMKLLVNKRLINHFSDIRTAFNSFANETRGVKEGIVYSVHRLSSEEISKLSASLEKKLGSKVELTSRLEPSLLGGVRIYIDDKVFDGSIETKLENLRNTLLKD